jgi:hypothetical protein
MYLVPLWLSACTVIGFWQALRVTAHILHHGSSSVQVSHGDTGHCCMDCHCIVSSCYIVSIEFNYINESRSDLSNNASAPLMPPAPILLRAQFPSHSIMVYFIHSNTIYCCVCQFMRNSIFRLSSTRIVSLLPPILHNDLCSWYPSNV